MTGRLSIHKDNSELDNFKAINQVVDMLDWYKVHKVMKSLDWVWGFEGSVPEVYELKETALKYAEEAISQAFKSQSGYCCESGGIRVNAKYYLEGDVHLEVMFILESWDNSL
jgi:hypothetical protein